MSAISESRLPFDSDETDAGLKSEGSSLTPEDPIPKSQGSSLTPDDAARQDAVDPSRNVVLEASAGTGKTRVLVERYVNLLRAGVDPDHILAMTFTRKAAAEMRERIIARLRKASRCSSLDLARWRDLKDRLGDISISTIDAFCLSLLREFPLEADVDPGFELADDTETPRLIGEALDQALRICRAVARDDEDVALVFAQLGERRLRQGLTALLDRRLVAPQALRRYLEQGPLDLTAALACRRAAERLRTAIAGVRGGVEMFLADGPVRHLQFAMLAADIRGLSASVDDRPLDRADGQAAFRALIDRLRGYFLTQEGKPREKAFAGTGFKAADCDSDDAWKRHREAAAALAPAIAEGIRAFRRDLNVVMSRGVWRIFAVALQQYQRTLESRALLDFAGVLERAVSLLKDMDEFSQSRFRLEARYRHVLVDEFQDTSRAQWALVSHLVRSWSEGLGAAADGVPPSIFIVGDRKQSIYGFRDADVTVLDEAAAFIEGLRADPDPRRAISVSFRAVPALLAFVNDLFGAIEKAPDRSDAFRYEGSDRFPVGAAEVRLPPSRAERASASLADQPPPGLRRSADALATAEALGEGGKPDTTYEADPDTALLPDREDPLGLIVADTVGQTAERVAVEIVRLFSDTTVRDRATGMRRLTQPADVAILFRSRDSHREFEKALERRGVSTYVYKGLGFFEADEVQDGVAFLRYLADPTSNLRAAALLRSRIVRLSDGAIACLAPAIALALIDPDPPLALGRMAQDDRRVLERLRASVPRWLACVDRMTPTEVFGELLAETAYSFEMGGVRGAQARENLKKLRGMVARFQNRGYATIARVADHLEQLAVGDESNAALDARDSVSLMTVHAAKGLEFPIVFLVNFGRGSGSARAPIRVSAGPDGEASVAIADFQSEADEDVQARDREETKRLLYVALTRARDRLYLSTPVQDEVCRMGRGSLGEVLPASFRTVLISAAAVRDRPQVVTWAGPSGTEHRFVV